MSKIHSSLLHLSCCVLTLLSTSVTADESREATYFRETRRTSFPNQIDSVRIVVSSDKAKNISIQFRHDDKVLFGFIAVGDEAHSLLTAARTIEVSQYILQASSGQNLEFRRRGSAKPFLPFSFDLQPNFFLPNCLNSAGDFIDRCEFLGEGFVLSHETRSPAPPLPDSKIILISDDLFVGTSRNSRDIDSQRIPQSRFAKDQNVDYRYRPLDEQDFARMLDAGMNYFDRVLLQQFQYLADKPAFFDLNSFKADAAKLFPEVFYHPGFLGVEDFLDEPAYILWEDSSEAPVASLAEMAKKQEQATSDEFHRRRRGRMTGLMEHLRQAGIDLGATELIEPPFPIWEEFYDTACYQLRVPVTGFIQEGRYRHPETVDLLNNTFRTSLPRRPDTMLRFYFAFVRGGVRVFGKDWGTSIYGQADPEVSLQAITTAYDSGARYIFFWSSDRDHHLPFAEQLALAAGLSKHIRENPRPSREMLVRSATDAIVLPYGFTFPISDWQKDRVEDLWQRKCFPLESGTMPDGTPYYSVLRTATEKMQQLMKEGRDFDFVVDVPELESAGYARLHRVLPDAQHSKHRYPRWIHHKLYFLLAGLITFWISYRIYRVARYRRNATRRLDQTTTR